jgi:hypothetical protein
MGILPSLCENVHDNEIVILQYVNDTLLLLKEEEKHARNLKFIFCLFEQLCELKMNHHKSEV